MRSATGFSPPMDKFDSIVNKGVKNLTAINVTNNSSAPSDPATEIMLRMLCNTHLRIKWDNEKRRIRKERKCRSSEDKVREERPSSECKIVNSWSGQSR